jgi:hypothetical protein
MARGLFPLLLIVACSQPAPGPVSRGAAIPAVQAAAPPELSTIVIPIRSNLSSIASGIESRIESAFTGRGQERGIDIRYDVARSPIVLTMVGAGLHS